MSCIGFLTPAQRAALRASSNDGAPLSSFASPPPSDGKRERLRSLARSTDPRIRESAALARHTPADVLVELGRDAAETVRRSVARNPHAPPAALRALAADEVPDIRAWVVANPGVPDDVLLVLAEDPDPMVQAVLEWAAGWA